MKNLIEEWEIKVQSLKTFGSSIEKACELNTSIKKDEEKPDTENRFNFKVITGYQEFEINESYREKLISDYNILDLESEIAGLETRIINKFRHHYGVSLGANQKEVNEYCEHNLLIPIERRDVVYGIMNFIKECENSKEEK